MHKATHQFLIIASLRQNRVCQIWRLVDRWDCAEEGRRRVQAALLMGQEQVLALLLLLEEGGLVASNLRAVTGKHVLQILLLGSKGKGTERMLEVGRRGIVIVAGGSRWPSLLRRSRDLRTKECHGVTTLLVLNLINYQPRFFLDSALVRAKKLLILIDALLFLDLTCVSFRWRHCHLSIRSL